MPRPCYGRSVRDGLLFTISCAALSDMVLTSGLWLPDSMTGRSCPRSPALTWWFAFMFPLPEYIESILLLLLWLMLFGMMIWALLPSTSSLVKVGEGGRSERLCVAIGATYTILCLSDVQRNQTWFYQYIIMIVSLSLKDFGDAVLGCRLVIVATYVWSGMLKFNPAFPHTDFVFMLQTSAPPVALWLRGHQTLFHIAAWGAGAFESSTGLVLYFSRVTRLRRLGVMMALGMHGYILGVVMYANWEKDIWPWNFFYMCLVCQLFWNTQRSELPHTVAKAAFSKPRAKFFRSDQLQVNISKSGVAPNPSVSSEVCLRARPKAGKNCGRNRAQLSCTYLVVLVLPFLAMFNRMDTYVSFGMYTGNDPHLIISMGDKTMDSLPETAKKYVNQGMDFVLAERNGQDDWSKNFHTTEKQGRNLIDAFGWCALDLGAQPYPAPRVYKAMACKICFYAKKVSDENDGETEGEGDDLGVRLLLLEKLNLADSYKARRRTVYTCEELGCN